MKVNIDIECTPQEARQFMGLPDVEPMQAAVMKKIEERMLSDIEKFSPDALMRNWLALFPQNADWLQDMMNKLFAGAGDGAGKGAQGNGSVQEPLDQLDFLAFFFDSVCRLNRLSKYLSPEQVNEAKRLCAAAQPILKDKDEARAKALLPQMQRLKGDIPAPVLDMFFAMLITEDRKVVTPTDKGQVEDLMRQMESAVQRDDIDTANEYLHQLRDKTTELFEKYPSDLLRH